MKTIVLYRSKTGYVEKYAQWIAEALSADIMDVSKANLKKVLTYDRIIFGGSLHAVGIIGIKFIKRNFNILKEKKLVIFTCGASLPGEKVTEFVRDSNFTKEQQQFFKLFYFRGGFNYHKLPLYDKFLMTLMKWKIIHKKKKGDQLSEDEIGMLTLYDSPHDFTSKDNILEIINYINL